MDEDVAIEWIVIDLNDGQFVNSVMESDYWVALKWAKRKYPLYRVAVLTEEAYNSMGGYDR